MLFQDAEYDLHAWHPVRYGFEGNQMRLHGYRYFEEVDDNRAFKLGTVRKWTVGFYDYNKDKGAWSDDLELVLDNGFDEQAI
jgi:hypothetical protein